MHKGKEGISATIIKDSVHRSNRITTFELEYPRIIHGELMTHRMLSKNCASSRAIPFKKMNEHVLQNPAVPVWWGKNQPGMQAKEEVEDKDAARRQWINISKSFVDIADHYFESTSLHKQIVNRLTEPFQRMKTVITGTEWSNFLWLRDHEDAQPEFAELAACIRQELMSNVPDVLSEGEWHLPYVRTAQYEDGVKYYCGESEITLQDAIKLSASCCAQVSYRNSNETLEKAIDIYDKLINSGVPHFSPFEHQATPISLVHSDIFPADWYQLGITHMTADMELWSGNFRGWIQNRQLIMHDKKIPSVSRV